MPSVECSVCVMHESDDPRYYPPEVIFQIKQDNKLSYIKAAAAINLNAKGTIVVVQHEYGIYGGEWGKYLLTFLKLLRCPVISTMHTIVAEPTKKIRQVTEGIIKRSDLLITLTDSSLKLFLSLYPTASKKTVVIEHGIHPVLYLSSRETKPRFRLSNRPVIITFGLLSRNKGIEYVIRSLPRIKRKIPNIMYLVVGSTHPGVKKLEGESYRHELVKLVDDLCLKPNVRFVPDYLPLKDILAYLQAADLYIATTLDPHQAVSGTLSYALGVGRTVVSTKFSQAKEIVHKDIGRIVPIGNPKSISTAVTELLADTERLETMHRLAYSQTRSMLWSNVADDYVASMAHMFRQKGKIKLTEWPDYNWRYLEKMTDKFGLLQFSKHANPDPGSGYTLDDNSRALQVVLTAQHLGVIPNQIACRMATKYLHVIETCLSQIPVANYLSVNTKKPTAQNKREDLSDSLSRAYYALQSARQSHYKKLSEKANGLISNFPLLAINSQYIKPTVQLLLGATIAAIGTEKKSNTEVRESADKLVAAYEQNATAYWRWFEKSLTYANGQFCASLIEAAIITKSSVYKKIGLESLEFLCSVCFMGNVYVPIGQDGWLTEGGERKLFDQQPEDVFSMLQALEAAFRLTGKEIYKTRAKKAFSWFLGNNLVGVRVYDDKTSGCHDGLECNGVNSNEGAESTLSYLGARLIMARLFTRDD